MVSMLREWLSFSRKRGKGDKKHVIVSTRFLRGWLPFQWNAKKKMRGRNLLSIGFFLAFLILIMVLFSLPNMSEGCYLCSNFCKHQGKIWSSLCRVLNWWVNMEWMYLKVLPYLLSQTSMMHWSKTFPLMRRYVRD